MCGIIGYTGRKNALPRLIEGLKALEYRGYDSAGVAFVHKNGIKAVKSKGRIALLEEKLKGEQESFCAIGHTRWATHGEPSDVNSHPHGTDSVYIVHNGIIENYAVIKEFLTEKGYSFESETDTETAAKLIDWFYSKEKSPISAIRKALEMISGSYAIGAVFEGYPDKIYAFRKDSPLLAAPSEDGGFITSDISAILRHTREFIRLEEGEIAVLSPDSIEILSTDNTPIERDFETVSWDIEAAEKGGYDHFMLKEIFEQPDAVKKTLSPRVTDGLPTLDITKLAGRCVGELGAIHIVACGTAYHAGLIGQYAIEKLARIPVKVELASEFRYKNPILRKNDLVIIISQSGETADSLAALRLAKERGVRTLAVVNVAGSTIAQEADSVLLTWAGPEIAVASTKAFSVQIALLYLFAIRLALDSDTISEEEARQYCTELTTDVPAAISKALDLTDLCSSTAQKYKDNSSIFFIGRGASSALAHEAALKMKEISYIHCEAYAAGELKHGTISLITDGTPVFAFLTNRSTADKMISNIREVKTRGARVMLFCREGMPIPDGIADDIIPIPSLSQLFMPMSEIIAAQLVAYYMSCHLGCDVDKPRNLAKSVTVE
ncbi:MAG: glutamine--fructose-6-phosphate transaminase (isomerizing) [Clostridia bacterium]|nr:glutamine--fructose-6-phosphate transaminase (isomerizing) [Clostridia bacterium]